MVEEKASLLVRRLRRLDCCAISDAMDRLNLSGIAQGLSQHSGAGRIAGRAITVKLGTGEPPPGPPRHLGATAIEAGGPDDVIVIEQRTGIDAGCWGGLLTLGAKMRTIPGVIADGPVRDIDEAQSYGFPIFARALTARTARGRIVEKGTNLPVQIGGIDVQPGDFVAADRSAVIFIGAADAEKIITTAEAIVAREGALAKALISGAPVSGVMGGAYEHMLKDLL